jgi:hypothetical protein
MTVAAWAFDLGSVGVNAQNRHVVIAYDDQFSVEYMYRKLRPLYLKRGYAEEKHNPVETAVRD